MSVRPRTPRLLAALLTAGALAAVAACAPIEPEPTGASTADAAAATSEPTAGATAEVTPESTASATPSPVDACTAAQATPRPAAPATLADGPRTAEVADMAIHPVAQDPAAKLPVTVASEDGTEVTVTDTSRIVAVDLYGTLGEIVWSLGLGDQVVGRDTSTAFKEAADVPVVTGDGHALNVEAILGLDPSVILADESILTDATRTQLERSGVPVVLFDPTRTLDGIEPRIEAVAKTLGVPAEGEMLADRTAEEVCVALAAVPEPAKSPRVAFLYLRGGNIKLLFGPGSGADDLLDAVGAEDAGTAIGLTREYVPITSEALISAAPDAYLVMTGGLESAGGLDAMLTIPGVGQTPAGEAKRVIDVDDSDLLTFGPRTAGTITALADALYGDGK